MLILIFSPMLKGKRGAGGQLILFFSQVCQNIDAGGELILIFFPGLSKDWCGWRFNFIFFSWIFILEFGCGWEVIFNFVLYVTGRKRCGQTVNFYYCTEYRLTNLQQHIELSSAASHTI